MTTTTRPPESDADEVVVMLVQSMAEREIDELAQPLFHAGKAHLLMVGPHNVGGLCWCLPRFERVVCTNFSHSAPEHFVFVHDDRVN